MEAFSSHHQWGQTPAEDVDAAAAKDTRHTGQLVLMHQYKLCSVYLVTPSVALL